MRVDPRDRKALRDRSADKRRQSKVANTALRTWRQAHPAEWEEAWPVVTRLVKECYRDGTPNARHSNALNVMRSALAKECPEQWAQAMATARLTA